MKLPEAVRMAKQRIKQIDGDIFYMDEREDSPTQRELDKATVEMLKREKACLTTLIKYVEDNPRLINELE